MKNVMILNEMIIKNKGRERKHFTARFDKDAMDELMWNLNHNPLCIYEFTTLSYIYGINFTFIISIKLANKIEIKEITKDEYYPGCIGEYINSIIKLDDIETFGMTFEDIQIYLSKHDGKIEVK